MKLDERKQRILAMIVDRTEHSIWFPTRERFRAERGIDRLDRAALDEMSRAGLLMGRGEYIPTLRALRSLRSSSPFAAAEFARALAMLPVMQEQYYDGLSEKSHSVGDMARTLSCGDQDVRRCMHVLNPLGIFAWWQPPVGQGPIETYKLAPQVLDVSVEELDSEEPAQVSVATKIGGTAVEESAGRTASSTSVQNGISSPGSSRRTRWTSRR